MNNKIDKDQIQIFSNGTFYIDAVKKAENIAVKNGTVIGTDVDLEKYKDAQIIDVKGGCAFPGFNDSHVHLVETGIAYGGVNLIGCSTTSEIVNAVAEKISEVEKGNPLFGMGFYPDNYDAWSLEDLAVLDKVTGDVPVMLVDQLGHNCIINSAAIKICNLTAETEIPMGGKVIIQNGKSTGMLRESAMTIAGNSIFPLFSDEIIRKGAEKILKNWASVGYTSVVDLMGGPMGRMLKADLCKKMEKEEKLPLRINYMYTFSRLDEIENALEFVGKDTDMVRFGGLKLFVDGAYAGGQAWTSWQNRQGNNGLYYVYNDDSYGKQYNINRIIEKVNELELNIHYHAQGDKAIGAVLDALDAAVEKHGKLTSVHTLIHLAFPTDEQIERIKGFGGHVVTTVQPAFWEAEGDTTKYYGEPAKTCYPVKKLFDAGISTGISTDYSVSPIELSSPTTIMGIALTGNGEPENHTPLSVENLVEGLTVGSTATIIKKDTGKLESGYKADMVIFEKDLYLIPADKFNKDYPKVLSTWTGGEKVYDSNVK